MLSLSLVIFTQSLVSRSRNCLLMLRQTFLYLSRQKTLQRLLLRSTAARRVAERFVAGETLASAVVATRQLNADGRRATLDHLGENVSTFTEAAAAREAYIETLAEIQRQELQSGISVKLTQLGLDVSESECAAHWKRWSGTPNPPPGLCAWIWKARPTRSGRSRWCGGYRRNIVL